MFLFFVRHAQSECSGNCWQTPDSKLGEIGKRQAEELSKRSRFSKLDKIFSSEWNRAYETARIVSGNSGVKVEKLDYIHEREQLPEIYGAARDGKISKEYADEYYKNYKNMDWKFRDKEESIREVIKRASKLSNFLIKNYQDKRLLVVSHDLFIRCFMSLTLLGNQYSDETMVKTINSLTINNTGISLLIYDSKRKSWKINYVNDYSHLKYPTKSIL